MSEYIIPSMTDVGPVTKIEQGENGYKATIGYTAQAIDEMVRRVNEKLDEEMMARLAEQHGYVRVVRCRDCVHATISTMGVCKYCEMFVLPDTDGYGADPQVNLPLDFFCGFAERKVVGR